MKYWIGALLIWLSGYMLGTFLKAREVDSWKRAAESWKQAAKDWQFAEEQASRTGDMCIVELRKSIEVGRAAIKELRLANDQTERALNLR